MRRVSIAAAAICLEATCRPAIARMDVSGENHRLEPGQVASERLSAAAPVSVTRLSSGIDGTIRVSSFSRASYNRYFSFLLNRTNPAVLFSEAQGGYYATDAVTVGVTVPSTANNHQANGIAVYMDSHRPRAIGNGGDVAGYFQANASASNANVFGINTVVADAPAQSAQALQNEMDFNVGSSSTSVEGLGLVLNASVPPNNPPNGFVCRTAASPMWNSCVYAPDGSASYALLAGAAGTGNDVPSQRIALTSRSSSGMNYLSTIHADASGSLLLRPGTWGGAIGFQDYGGRNDGYIDAKGLVVSVGVLTLPAYRVSTLPVCNAALKGSFAHATDLAAVTFNAAAAGGGSNDAPVYCDGTDWRVH